MFIKGAAFLTAVEAQSRKVVFFSEKIKLSVNMCRFAYTRQYLAQTPLLQIVMNNKKRAFRVDETRAFSPGPVLLIIPIFR